MNAVDMESISVLPGHKDDLVLSGFSSLSTRYCAVQRVDL